jgi:hypothetical protein
MGKVLPFLERSHPDDDEAVVDSDLAAEWDRVERRIDDALWLERLLWVSDERPHDECE